MKRVMVLMACLLVGQASADTYYTLDTDIAEDFTQLSVTGGEGELRVVTTDPLVYGGDTGMNGLVGYKGWIDPASTVMAIGMNRPAEEDGGWAGVGLGGSFDGFQAFIANDNNQRWSVQLFLRTTDPDGVGPMTGSEFYSGLASIDSGSGSWLKLITPFDFDSVADFGFQITGVNDQFHISAVAPVPAAVLIGMLGLGVAGLKLRKYV